MTNRVLAVLRVVTWTWLLTVVFSATSVAVSSWQRGFDFRNTKNYVNDPSGSNYVLPSTSYPTTSNGVTYGWASSAPQGANETTKYDPRLAGINYLPNGTPIPFYVDLPSPGIYNITMAMGNAMSGTCQSSYCQVQFLDGKTVLATIYKQGAGTAYFYDAKGNLWSANDWPTKNVALQVTITGTRLTMMLGSNSRNGNTPIAYLGITQQSAASFTIVASPAFISIAQGNQKNSTISTSVSGGFNNSIALSASGVPAGTTVSFNPGTIAAPGSGTSTMNISVGSTTAVGTYPITVTGSGGGVKQSTTVTITVVSPPDFAISASPAALSITQGNQGTSTLTTTVSGGFSDSIALSASGAPSGVSVSFNPQTIPTPGAGNSVCTLSVSMSTVPGTYPITVTAKGGGIQHTAVVTLTVLVAPSFAISASPATLSVAQGSQGSSTITTTISGGFNNAVALSYSGAPSGTTLTLTPQTIPAPGAGNSVAAFLVGSNTALGTYPITITGSGGGIFQSVTITLTVTAAATYDTYGGLTALPVPGCPQTGYFQLQKFSSRWVLATPSCNTFYQRAVYDADFGYISSDILNARYDNDKSKWATHALQRMQAYGFNSLDIYYSTYMLPTGTYGSQTGASIQVPFFLFWTATNDVVNHPASLGLTEAIKDLCAGQSDNGFNGYCGYTLDVFDAKWTAANNAELGIQATGSAATYTGGFANNPWIIAISLGDSDMLFAIKGNGAGTNGVPQYPHGGMLIATAAFDYGSAWQDPSLYSKYAWACNSGNSYLEKKYGNIAALNTAWGTGGFYTSFCDAGGFGTGTGVLDEDGRHTSWFGSDYYNQKGMNTNLLADLNAFLYQFAYQAYAAQITALRGYDTNHLFACGNFGGSGDGGVRPQVMQALRDAGCNMTVLNWDSTYPAASLAANQAAYDAAGLPTALWYGSTAQADSDMAAYPHSGAPDADYSTQAQRGQQYATDQPALFTAQGTNGDYFVVGTSFWSLTDNGSEKSNWGLLSLNDNAYDGLCAVMNPSTDPWGIACGGEAANYGDFLDAVTQTNAGIVQQLLQQLH